VGIENPVHLLFIAIVALIVLGPKRLPGLARALGHGIREFREAIGQGESAAERRAHTQAADPVEPVWPAQAVDPVEHVRSPDAPDRGPL
jgi:TatA/E family protein of Tat protein translocase